jgi:hypothetical protein
VAPPLENWKKDKKNMKNPLTSHFTKSVHSPINGVPTFFSKAGSSPSGAAAT